MMLTLPLGGSSVGIRIESNSTRRVQILSESGEKELEYVVGPSQPFLTFLGEFASAKTLMPPAIQLPIELDGPEEDVKAVQGMAFRLAAAQPLSPFGNTSERYGGHVFWDADMWMFPAQCLVNPTAAQQILQFRANGYSQAIESAQDWLSTGRKIGGGTKLGSVNTFPGKPVRPGAKFPWEAGPKGHELGVSETRFQEHISADVAWMVKQAAALGLNEQPSKYTADGSNPNMASTSNILKSTEEYYRQRITEGEPCELKKTVSVSEWHTVDNDLFTNALLDTLYPFSMKLPRDERTFLSFDNDKLGEYQQAAALLAIFPVQHPVVEKEAAEMLHRFADKVADEGPAMSHSISATIAARLGKTDEAYTYWKKSWQLYTDDPLLRFREKPLSGDSYFYTGAAGCMNTIYYGFMGLRIDPFEPKNKPWKLQLREGYWISAEPHLPSAWNRLQVDINVLGNKYRLVATHHTFTAEPKPS